MLKKEKMYVQKNLHYTRGMTLRRVTRDGGHLRGSAPELSNTAPKTHRSGGDAASDWTSSGIKPDLPQSNVVNN